MVLTARAAPIAMDVEPMARIKVSIWPEKERNVK